MPKTRRVLSEEERAERRRADRAFAAQAVEQLRCSEGWQQWLAARRHFRAYSLANQLLIAMQRPEATRVAGLLRAQGGERAAHLVPVPAHGQAGRGVAGRRR
jgi:hypothetical protein